LNQTEIVVLTVLGLLGTALVLALAYWWYRKNKPIHTFIGVDFGTGTVQPRRIKNLFGPFKFKRNDGQKVMFPVPQGFEMPRQDAKGTVFFGDMNTGLLFKPINDLGQIQAVHGIYNELALANGRIKQIVSNTQGVGVKLEHILMAIGVVVLLLIFNIYQYAKG
jgi:hypothetical protein